MKQIKPSARNATIAEILEQRPELGAPGDEYLGEGRIGRDVSRFRSPLKAWVWFPEVLRWYPLDFLHDARGTVMLLEKLHDFGNVALCGDNGWGVHVEHIDDSGVHTTYVNPSEVNRPTIGEAVARAFLRANGVEVSDCYGCRHLIDKPLGDGYYRTYFCAFTGGAVIGDEKDDPQRCDKYEEVSE